jgi:hypothetical protein
MRHSFAGLIVDVASRRPDARAVRILACAFMLTGAAVQPVRADRVPSHLAGMAASLYKAADAEFNKADPEESHGWAALRARRALRENDVHRWGATPPPQWNGRTEIVKLLELDAADPRQAKALQDFMVRAQSEGVEAAFLELLETLERPVPDAKPLATLVTKVEEALSAGFGDLARSHLIETDGGPDIALRWQPEQGRFRIDVEEPGSEFVAPFRTRLEGQLEPVPPEETGDAEAAAAPVAYELKPAPAPIQTLDAEDLREIRISVFGEWYDQEGTRWMIAPLGGENENDAEERPAPNPRAALLDRIAAAEAELVELRGNTVFVWENPETGEREEQKRFRRKTEPWEYLGEQTGGEGSAERVSELEQEISKLNDELTSGPRVQPAPDLQEPTDDGRVQAIRVAYTREDGSMAVMEQARLAGNRITGNRTLDDLRDINGLPDTVISQLVNEWSPPEWIELEASVADDGTTQIRGTRWRLHVTYSGDSYRIKRIHTPYPRPHNLNRDSRRKAP